MKHPAPLASTVAALAIALAATLVASVVATLVAGPVAAATLVVHPDGSGPYPTIQAAIDAAGPGDTVALASGTFRGAGNRDVDFGGKAITVESQDGDPATCIVDCEGTIDDTHRGFFFTSGEGASSVLRNLTITHALVTGC